MERRRFLYSALAAASLTAIPAARSSAAATTTARREGSAPMTPSQRQNPMSCNGMVTSPHYLASQAGLDILRRGGTAIDAAVATAATLAVVYPQMCTLGGDNFWLIYDARTGKMKGLNASGRAGEKASIDFYRSRGLSKVPARGYLAANTVPGVVSGWDEAWNIVSNCVAYTNHTVMAEALEVWPQQLFESLLPRVWQILTEIARRYQEKITEFYHGDMDKVARMAVIWDGAVRMANLCIAGGMAVNGVSALHSDILRKDVFRDQCVMEPDKFKNVTNGVDHRRWLSQINPGLDSLLKDTVGEGYLTHAGEMSGLERWADDKEVLLRLGQIKKANKDAFAKWAYRQQGVVLNTDGIFDVQVKRLHEYKRQLMNALHIIYLYQQLRDDPNMAFTPHTFLFGAKAAPGYAVAKRIIHLINSLANEINNDPVCKDKLQVVFLENYRVSMAEMLMPASEVSQQISTAGKEASGTGNMKFMMNGALTVGTLDGANVEMHQVLGDDNMFLFGLRSDEVAHLQHSYDPHLLYDRDPMLRRVVDQLKIGFSDGVSYEDLWQRLVFGADCPPDQYMLLADLPSYAEAEQRMIHAYADQENWNRMSLINIARSGIFAADRSIADYADTIWHVPYKK